MDSRDELARLYDACLRLNDGRLLLEGTAARAGVLTANGRIYPPQALRRAARQFSRGAVRAGLALGELDHPSYASSLYRSVSLANASHAVLRLEWRRESGRWWRRGGDAAAAGELRALLEVLPTPSGILLWELAARGTPLAISQRCWAEVEWRLLAPAAVAVGERRQQPEREQQQQHQKQQQQHQQQQQQPPRARQVGHVRGATLELLTFDFVPDPANAGAWLRPVARRVVAGGGGRDCPALPHPSAVALAHLGAGSVSPARAAGGGGGAGLPTAATVVAALRAGGARLGRVGALELRSHYYHGIEPGGEEEAVAAPAEDACTDREDEEARAGELAALVRRGAPAEEGCARSLPAHWRRFAERALACEARVRERERARQRELQQQQPQGDGGGGESNDHGGDSEGSDAGGGGGEGCLPRWLSLWPASWGRLRRSRGRRRRGAAVAPCAPDAGYALLPPPLPPVPAPASRDPGEEDGGSLARARAVAAEVDAVLWSREAKARDVRRRVLLRRVPFAVPGSEEE